MRTAKLVEKSETLEDRINKISLELESMGKKELEDSKKFLIDCINRQKNIQKRMRVKKVKYNTITGQHESLLYSRPMLKNQGLKLEQELIEFNTLLSMAESKDNLAKYEYDFLHQLKVVIAKEYTKPVGSQITSKVFIPKGVIIAFNYSKKSINDYLLDMDEYVTVHERINSLNTMIISLYETKLKFTNNDLAFVLVTPQTREDLPMILRSVNKELSR